MSYQDKLNYLINAFGGADNFQKLLGVGPSAISNYKAKTFTFEPSKEII